MHVILLSGAKHFKEAIKELEFFEIETKYFPDNELYLRIPFNPLKKEILIQSMPLEPDKKLIELIFASKTLKDLGSDELIALIPYLAYTRQDRRFKEGEAISQLIVLEMMRDAGIKKILTIDAHFHSGIPRVEGLEIHNLKLAPYFKEFFKEFEENEDFLAIGPDDDAYELAILLAKELKIEAGYIEKKRISDKEVEVKKVSAEVENKNIILIDDIISTGGTIIEAYKLLKKEGAKDVYVAASHGLFLQDSLNKIFSIGIKEVITSNSIPSKASKLNVIPLMFNELNKLKWI